MNRIRKLVAIMFTDIQGYTSLMQQSEKEGLRIRDLHRKIFQSVTKKYSGEIIQYYGDGTLSIFQSSVEAVRCGIELQRKFRKKPSIPVRIGIHSGDILLAKEDIIGDAVNIASRVESVGVVGSILITAKVASEIKSQSDIPIKSLGSFHFKNDELTRELFAVSSKGLVIPQSQELKGKLAVHSNQSSNHNILKPNGRKLLLRKVLLLFITFLFVLGIGIAINRISQHQQKVRWARQVAVGEIERLSDESNYKAAYELALTAEQYIPNDSVLIRLWPNFSRRIWIQTDPPNAKIYRKEYDEPEDSWSFLGLSPVDSLRVYEGVTSWKAEKEGYQTVHLVEPPRNKTIKLDPPDSIPGGMLRIPAEDPWMLFIPGLEHINALAVDNFFIDKYEVTNIEYREFIDHGGYQNPSYWEVPFIKDGITISFKEAMSYFKDQTGMTGPASWVAGNYPNGEDNYPVSGVSWYEAAAYANFVGKQLPSIYHWNVAANPIDGSVFVPRSNLAGKGLAEVGSFDSMGRFGTYDLAGNVREWCWNQNSYQGQRFILGGGWDDPVYAFNGAFSQDPFDRSLMNGFRCILNASGKHYPDRLAESVYLPHYEPRLTEPVDDKTFDIFARQFDFDRTPFNIKVESQLNCDINWTCERIVIDAAYGNERMPINIFLPKHVKPPYQAVVYFPGFDVTFLDSSNPILNHYTRQIDFFLNGGRAVIFPVFKSTFERKDELHSDYPTQTNFYKDHVIMWVKDVRRTIDLLETRADIDTSKIAMYGYSWGSALCGIIPAVDPRIKLTIVNVGGLYLQPTFPEVDQINYLPRINIPVLMLNGKLDFFYPYELSQKPMFDLFGTPQAHKKHVLYDQGHFLPRVHVIKESLEWLNTYFGPPEKQELSQL